MTEHVCDFVDPSLRSMEATVTSQSGMATFTDIFFTDYVFSGRGAIYIREHDANDPAILIGEDQVIWEASTANDADGVSEAPYLVFDGTTPGQDGSAYYLFYSTGRYDQPSYTITYATSPFILGPYAEQGNLLATGAPGAQVDTLTGPGGATLIPGPVEHQWYMVSSHPVI